MFVDCFTKFVNVSCCTVLYLKHNVYRASKITMDRDPGKLNNHTVQCSGVQYQDFYFDMILM